MTRGFRSTAALLLFALAVALGQRLERIEKLSAPEHSLYLPSGRYLKWASLGHRGLVADLLYIWSIQYYSTEREDRWHWLAQIFDVITDLDPRFEVAYSVGALILSIEAGRTDHAIALLEKGMRANPERYLLAWEAAFYARDLRQRDRMIHYLGIAKVCPDAPSYVGRWHGFALVQSGRSEEALALWLEAYRTARTDYERQVAERYIEALQVDQTLAQLRLAIDAFRAREGRWPRRLDELVPAGLIAQVPLDPLGRPLRYDPVTGAVRAESGFLKTHRMLQ